MQLDILIVDDEPLLASLLKEMFQRSGHDVHIVDTVASALQASNSFRLMVWYAMLICPMEEVI